MAAVVATPVGLGAASPSFAHPGWLLAGAGVAICSSVIPYAIDQLVMARLPRASFALLLSLLPAYATIIGVVVLAQPRKTWSGWRWWASRWRSTQVGRRAMEQVQLGSSGLRVSQICLGMMSYGDPGSRAWILPEAEAEPTVRRAVEAGVSFFDTADMYSDGMSEQVTGRLLRKLFARRDDYVLATKVYYPMGPGANDRGLSRKHILASIDASLRRLDTDHVDLYQVHRWDYQTPIEETMAALHDVVRSGKARYLGASSMYAWQFAKAQHVAQLAGGTRFVSMQNHYNLVYREEEREMIPLCLDQGVGLLPWSPLARGLLAGNRERGGQARTVRAGSDPVADSMYEDADFEVVDAVRTVAGERDVPPAQVALAWLLSRPGVTAPIVGATQLPHLDDAVAAVELELTDPEHATLEAPYRPHRVLGHT